MLLARLYLADKPITTSSVRCIFHEFHRTVATRSAFWLVRAMRCRENDLPNMHRHNTLKAEYFASLAERIHEWAME